MAKQQTEIDIGGVKFKGGRVFLIITILSSFIGVLWGGFEAYQRYLDMEKKINSFVSPDLSGFDKKLEVVNTEVDMLQSEISIILEEVSLVADVAKELKNDLDKEMNSDFSYLAKQGILLLNSSLTVHERLPGSHLHIWEDFTNNVS